jgi:hypothetical protein
MPVEIGELTTGYEGSSSHKSAFEESISAAKNFAIQVRGMITQGLMEHKERGKFRIVDTTQIDRIITQHNFEMSDWSDSDKIAEVGKALNADIICITILGGNQLQLSSSRASLMISVTFLDVNTMEVLGSFSKSYRDPGGEYKKMENRFITFPDDIKKMTLFL